LADGPSQNIRKINTQGFSLAQPFDSYSSQFIQGSLTIEADLGVAIHKARTEGWQMGFPNLK
jgi:hypothetical protein